MFNFLKREKKFEILSSKTKKDYLKSLKLEEEDIKEVLTPKHLDELKKESYTIYDYTFYGKLANRFFGKLTAKFVKRFPKFFKNIHHFLMMSDIKVLSKTYFNMMFFFAFIALIISFIIIFILGTNLISALIIAFFSSILIAIGVFGLMYLIPIMSARNKSREIKDDLPFVIIHMAAIAGSGAHPLSMFNLILSSGEYKGVEKEIKRIVNYVNLFGYNLSTALRNVAKITPSKEFGELLNGIVSAIESGGDLEAYLNEKAKDAMSSYKLERQKYVETISTYSDVYMAVLIAAPLLFLVVLAIINIINANVAGFDAEGIAKIGTFGVIPLLNLIFIIFINMVQPT